MVHSVWLALATIMVPLASSHVAAPPLKHVPLVRRILPVNSTTIFTTAALSDIPAPSQLLSGTNPASTSITTESGTIETISGNSVALTDTTTSNTSSTPSPEPTLAHRNSTNTTTSIAANKSAKPTSTTTAPWTTAVCLTAPQSFIGSVVASTNETIVTGMRLSAGTKTPVLIRSNITHEWVFSNGGLALIQTNTTTCSLDYFWLTIGTLSKTTIPLTWSENKQITKTWGGGLNKSLVADSTSAYPTITRYMACQSPIAGEWTLSLYTGTGVNIPIGCAITELEVKT